MIKPRLGPLSVSSLLTAVLYTRKIKNALKIVQKKKLGFVVVVNNDGLNKGIFTDGDLKRSLQRKKSITNFKIKSFMTKKPYSVEENTLASDILHQMNKRKITSVCVYNRKNKKKTIGVIHIHHLLKFLKWGRLYRSFFF